MESANPLSSWAQRFAITRNRLFFNHAAVAPISPAAADALQAYTEYAQEHAYVGSNWYARLDHARQQTARLLNAHSPEEIAFVPNTSTGLALVARGLDWRKGDEVVITNVEYPANRYPWEDLKRFGVRVVEVEQTDDCRIPLEAVLEAITDRTKVVAISHVQYATGHRIDLKPIADMVHQAGGYLCVDAIQSLGCLPVDVQASGIDFLSADGHKWLMAPEGAGIFYCRQDRIADLHPAVVGWSNMVNASDYGSYDFTFRSDARRFEPGTWNVPGTLALGASMDMLLEIGMQRIWQQISDLTAHARQGLVERGYRVVSPAGEGETSGILSFVPTRAGVDPAQIITALDKQKITIALREGRLRFSPHFYNTTAQIDQMLEVLPQG